MNMLWFACQTNTFLSPSLPLSLSLSLSPSLSLSLSLSISLSLSLSLKVAGLVGRAEMLSAFFFLLAIFTYKKAAVGKGIHLYN